MSSAWESVTGINVTSTVPYLSTTMNAPTIYPGLFYNTGTMIGGGSLPHVTRGYLTQEQYETLIASHRYLEIEGVDLCGLCAALGLRRDEAAHRFMISGS